MEFVELMKVSEVAKLYHVDAKTVTRWAKTGKIPCIKTPGGHRRYVKDEVMSAYEQSKNV